MEEITLIFRHLPAELSKEERKDFLFNFGASRVNVMGSSGRMKNTAFAVFPSKDHATEVLHQLHQADLLGSKLVVEIARSDDSATPSLLDGDKQRSKDVGGRRKLDQQMNSGTDRMKTEPREIKFDATFCSWGLKHPRRPELRYRYPPPTPSILTNIMNALVALPKFYVQVLHLMNKMDLPAPFGSVTPAPPMVPSQAMPDDVDQREMDISVSEDETESEMESEGDDQGDIRSKESKKLAENARRRRKILKKVAHTKRPRLSEFQQNDNSAMEHTASTKFPIKHIFEQMPEPATTQTAKKMALNIKLPSMESHNARKVTGSLNWDVGGEVLQQLLKQQQQQLYQQTLELTSLPSSSTNPLPVTTASHDSNNVAQSSYTHPIHQHPPQHHIPPPQHQMYQSQPAAPTPSIQDSNLDKLDGHHQPHTDPDYQMSKATSKSQLYSPSMYEEDAEEENNSEKSNQTFDGFGKIQHTGKVSDDSRQDTHVDRKEDHTSSRLSSTGSDKKFISSSALRKGRLTKEEMQDSSVFRRYDPGEASCRLYIKNVARQVTESDLRYIYGRYVDWESETEVNMFDIRLMREGRMKGQAFVTLPSQEVASDALSDTNGFLLKDKPLVVQYARSAKAQEDAKAIKT